MSRLAVFVASAFLCPATLVRAQSWEASGLIGSASSAALDRRAPDLSRLDLSGGFTWGVEGTRFFTPHWGAEVLWMLQSSAQRVGTAAGAADLFTLTAGQLHGNVVYRFGGGNARLQPFAFAGLGATFFRSDEVPSETRFSLGLGGGVNYFFFRSVGVRGQLRYKPTVLNDTSSGDVCLPFGFCQGTLQQVEFAAGAVVRF